MLNRMRQLGFISYGAATLIFLLFVFTAQVLRVAPGYYRSYLIQITLDSVGKRLSDDNEHIHNLGAFRQEFIQNLDRQLTINNIRDRTFMENTKMKVINSRVEVTVPYIYKTRLIYNIDALVKFELKTTVQLSD